MFNTLSCYIVHFGPPGISMRIYRNQLLIMDLGPVLIFPWRSKQQNTHTHTLVTWAGLCLNSVHRTRTSVQHEQGSEHEQAFRQPEHMFKQPEIWLVGSKNKGSVLSPIGSPWEFWTNRLHQSASFVGAFRSETNIWIWHGPKVPQMRNLTFGICIFGGRHLKKCPAKFKNRNITNWL